MQSFDKSLLIIPTYNEIENIEKMLLLVSKLYPNLTILIVDDNSPDGTSEIVKKYQKENPKIKLIQRSGKRGLGTAYIEGFKYSLENNFEFTFQMDCDFSHDPKYISSLLESALENDLVIGSRYIDGIRILNWPFHHLLLSYGASIYVRLITGLKILDVTGGYKCIIQKALKAINLDKIISNGYLFQIEINFKAWSNGFKIKEIPIIFIERRDGQSKMGGSIVKEAISQSYYFE